jgi:hypothetical protein
MGHRRSAMFIDFDNFFSGLLSSDPKAALELAERPSAWINRLATHDADDVRRWLVLRCYMNPSGSIAHPRPTARTHSAAATSRSAAWPLMVRARSMSRLVIPPTSWLESVTPTSG